MKPYLVKTTPDWACAFKPPLMHSAPLHGGEGGGTLLDWLASSFPEILEVRGRKPVEGGLAHRLDFPTSGLVLAARNQRFYDYIQLQQEAGRFLKTYAALCAPAARTPPGFSPLPPGLRLARGGAIESAFRPWGPRRAAVRPAPPLRGDELSALYRTEILEASPISDEEARARGIHAEGVLRLKIRLCRGFRHQIRAHLAWLGLPILGDTLYGAEEAQFPGIALFASGLHFPAEHGGGSTQTHVFLP